MPAVKKRTENLQSIDNALQVIHDTWIRELERYRNEYYLLKLFTNRQIMILILLLTPSTAQNKNRCHFLKKLYSWTITKNTTINENNEHEQELTMKCLYHYLHSLKIQAIDLSDKVLTQLYDENKIHDGDNIEKRLKRLCEFLNQIFDKDKRLFKNLLSTANNENQQYLVKLSKKILNHNDTDTKKIENDFDMETCCILLSTINNRLPSFYQIL
ncbi:unnamed protein product [Didymodactylos carnosus]|uniref:Uncharacterized protein n=1 Tax=Didymodactylos carnosus TaxID=1234261 RepID=A0A8S2E9R7_9BILA|nr:unnamed protein product [Didymodactylos carnosus]CAF3980692.1 unnamed protein product [Didymodactylos carnosus]